MAIKGGEFVLFARKPAVLYYIGLDFLIPLTGGTNVQDSLSCYSERFMFAPKASWFLF
jgi:hypothetical protein